MATRDLGLRITINGEDRSGAAFGRARANVQSISEQLETLQKRLTGFLALKLGDIVSGQIGEIIKTADAYKTLEARLSLVTDSTSEFTHAQTELLNIAQRTTGDLSATYDVYGKLATAIKQLGGTQEQALRTTETLNKAIALTSQGVSQDAAAILQFGQALGSGVLRGDEFNSVMENSPGLALALAEGLDVPIGKLREMSQAGELTADRLINALEKSAGSVEQKFSALPLTVSGAMTQLKNAFLIYIGEADKAGGATEKLAGLISTIAANLKPLANAVLIIAEIYGVKLALGLIKSAEAYVENKRAAEDAAEATEAAAEAAQASRDIEAQVALVRVKTARALIEEARLQAALARTETERAEAQNLLAQAMRNYHGAVDAANAAQESLGDDTEETGQAVGRFSGILAKLRGLVEKAFAVKIAIDIVGGTLESLGEYNEKIRIFSFAWQATIEELKATAVHFLSGDFLTEGTDGLRKKFDEIQQKYGDMAVASTDSARKVAESEQQKAKDVEAAALQQQAAFKTVEEATKQLTASIDSETTRQTATIQQSLTDRLAAIDAMNVSEAEKDNQRVQAKLQSYQLELDLQTRAGNAKLALIDQEYQAELANAARNAERTAEIETQKRQAKLAVYSGLADFYQAEVARLAQVYAGEFQAAQASRQQLQGINKSHEQALFDISLMGLSDREKLSEREYKFSQTMRQLRAELNKGDAGDQEKINQLLTDAKKLHGEITSTAGKGSSAIYDAKKRENDIYAAQKTVLERNAADHEGNASRAKEAQDEVADKLRDTQTAITDITTKLNETYALKIGVDEGSLTAIRETIAELTKPETKTITIQTVNAGAPAQATGGPAGQPAGQPWRFNTGGYAPRSGKLPGYGGGDKIRALLEAGEFIIRKEAVQKLGLPFMHAVNAGRLPTGGDVIKRALGGSVGYDMDDELKKLKDERDQTIIKRMIANARVLGLNSSGGGYSATKAKRSIGQMLERMGRTDLMSVMADIIDNSVIKLSALGARNSASKNQEKFDRAKILTEHLFDASAAATVPALQTPKITIPVPSLPSRPTPAASAASASTLQASKTLTVKFEAPGAAVSGQFAADDIDDLFRTLKLAGARTSGGSF